MLAVNVGSSFALRNAIDNRGVYRSSGSLVVCAKVASVEGIIDAATDV